MVKFVSTPILNNPVWSFGWIVAKWYYNYVDSLRTYDDGEVYTIDYYSGGIRYFPLSYS